jgi:hypothetical protein
MTKIERKAAIEAAESVLKTKAAIKRLQEQMYKEMELVREYVEGTGDFELGQARAFERRNAPKLVPVKRGTDVSKVLENFTSQVPSRYTKTQLDLPKMHSGQDSDRDLKKLLKRFGLAIDQDTVIQIKHY